MPGQYDGLDLARIIRQKWPAMPVLLATGYSDAAHRATQEGFTLLSKPYHPDVLAGALQKVVAAHPSSAKPA
jgi:CheY-like chemotaxis protein